MILVRDNDYSDIWQMVTFYIPQAFHTYYLESYSKEELYTFVPIYLFVCFPAIAHWCIFFLWVTVQ